MAFEKRGITAEERPLASYSNFFEIGHNAYEFLIDFGQFQPESAKVLLHTRIIFGPIHAKVFEGMLHESVQRYEAENGEIPNPPLAQDVNPHD